MPTEQSTTKPVILLAFANDLDERVLYLRKLNEEARRLQRTLEKVERAGYCELVVRQNATIEDILDVFQDAVYRDRIQIFHFGGHANGFELFFQGNAGIKRVRSEGLAAFLAQQKALRLVFLNGCSTSQQVRDLLAASIGIVIATERDIDDAIAMEFADRFYRGLASNATIKIAYHEAAHATQMLAGDSNGRHLTSISTTSSQNLPVQWPWSLHCKPGGEEKLQWQLTSVALSNASSTPVLKPLPSVPNPYRGLEPFDTVHAANYFGREEMVSKLIEKLTVTDFVVLIGSSGSGKSSLVRAGLINTLHEGALPGSRTWESKSFRPGPDPLQALMSTLVVLLEPKIKTTDRIVEARKLSNRMYNGILSIADLLNPISDRFSKSARFILVIDQFEEIFTLCSDDKLRRIFLDTILVAVASAPWLTVIVTLRADFYGRILEDGRLGKRFNNGFLNVLPMNEEEQRAAIEQPAFRAGRRFEPGLVKRILDAIQSSPGNLPLLEFALKELWDRQTTDGLLTHSAYEEIGEVSGAIARHAETVFRGLNAQQQELTKRLFRRLVRIPYEEESLDKLIKKATNHRINLRDVDPSTQNLARQTLANQSLVVTGRNEATGEETLELVHEVLIQDWPHLMNWVKADIEGLRIHQSLTETVTIWLRSNRRDDTLYRGERLRQVISWARKHPDALNANEQKFLEQSRKNQLWQRILVSSGYGFALITFLLVIAYLRLQSLMTSTFDEFSPDIGSTGVTPIISSTTTTLLTTATATSSNDDVITSTTPVSLSLIYGTPLKSTIDYDIGTIWQEDVLFFHQEREWRQVRRQALEVFGAALQQEANISVNALLQLSPDEQTKLIVDNLLHRENAAFWQQWQATIPIPQVEAVLFDTYVGIANQENKAGRPAEALTYFDAALLVRNDPVITTLNVATARYANAIGETNKTLAADALRELYNDYATQEAATQAFCSAAEYLSVANAMAQDNPYTDQVERYQQQCGTAKATPTPAALPAKQGGVFIYSTQTGSVYQIQRAVTDGITHTWSLLVENGSQPGVSPDGRSMAFFSRRNDSEGFSLYNFTAPLAPQVAYPRLSSFIEDSRISAPSWSPESNRVAFSSDREEDRRFRVYVAVPPTLNGTAYTLGEDPAWGPRLGGSSKIAYKGTNDAGLNPGIWLIDENGGGKAQLTNNGSDRRPVWSPDGRFVVFMRAVGNNNWELFRINVTDGSETQLTNHPADDGLPTISPNGRWVAFASDRGGRWAIWQVPLAGGSEELVIPMEGVLNNWLEHAIQWVK